ncbi:MAG: InlB B-repeat-containing protein [Clostridiales bacterium]|nr:InlB B-repeat-containing protein [Clostridiales bacterium]
MRKPVSRILSLLLAVIMIVGMGQQIFALDIGGGAVSVNALDKADAVTSPESIGDLAGLKTYLHDNIAICNTVISISTYKIVKNDENINTVFSIIQNDFPEFFHVDTLSLTFSGGYLQFVKLTYKMSRTEYENAMTAVNEKANYLLRDIESSSLSDAEKVMLVHDRLAVYTEYDYPASKEHAGDTYTLYGTLVNGVAVCQGYAETFVYLMNKLGIQARTIHSDSLNHTWNIVTIGGKEYHVDVTWDDKVIDTYGRVYHDSLLRSTDGIKSTGHTATDFKSSASDTKYDKYFWSNSIAEIQLFKGKLYYINNVDNTLREITSGTTSKVIVTLEKKWSNYYTTLANGNMVLCFSELSGDSKYLYYTSPTSVVKYDTVTQTTEIVYTPTLPGENYKIYGFKAYNNKFYLDLNTTPSMGASTRKDYGVIYPYNVTYTIFYDANGGSNAPDPVTKEAGKAIKISATVPTRKGYVFKGWAESASATTPTFFPNGNYNQDRSLKLYAVWQANSYQVMFDANTGSCETAVMAVLFGLSYGKLPVPLKEECEFVGWYTSLGADGKLVTKDTVVSIDHDHTLYAVWKGAEYQITFNADGGTVVPAVKTVNYGSNVTLPTPQRVGYDFIGWYDEEGHVFENESMYNFKKDITLTAHWDTAKFKVSFDANGGTVSVTEKTVTLGYAYGELPTPVRNGYNFAGWFTAKVGGTQITATSTCSAVEDITLYAHWSGKQYTIYFDVDECAPMTVTCGNPIGTMPKPVSKEKGYIFGGWYIDGVKVDENTVYNYTTDKAAAVKWQLSPALKIKGLDTPITVDYRTTVTLVPEYEDIPELKNAKVRWIVNGDTEHYYEAPSLKINEIKRNYTVQCQLVLDGVVISQSPVGTINVKSGLFAKIIAFLKAMFGRLPSYTVQAVRKMTEIG